MPLRPDLVRSRAGSDEPPSFAVTGPPVDGAASWSPQDALLATQWILRDARQRPDMGPSVPGAVLAQLCCFAGTVSKDGLVKASFFGEAAGGGSDGDTWMGRPFVEVGPWRGDATSEAELGALVARAAAGEAVALERPMRRADGTDGTGEFRMARVSADGEASDVICIVVDVTERARERELQTLVAEEAKHRIRNLLASVQGIAALTLNGCDEVRAAREDFVHHLQALAAAHTRTERSVA